MRFDVLSLILKYHDDYLFIYLFRCDIIESFFSILRKIHCNW